MVILSFFGEINVYSKLPKSIVYLDNGSIIKFDLDAYLQFGKVCSNIT